MAADNDAGAPADAPNNAPSRDGGNDTPPDTDLPDGVKKTLAAARRAERDATARAAELEAKVREFEDRDKSDAEKSAARTQVLEREAAEAKQEALRLRVAATKKLPAELIDRLRGTTKEELEADADTLLTLVKAPTPSFDGGPRGSADQPTDMDSLIRQSAGR